MLFGAVGDLHGDFEALDRMMARHPDVAFWVCPGDLASENGEYPHPRAPFYWIKGNNEDFDFVAGQPAGSGTIQNLHFIPNGVAVAAPPLRVAGLGGTFAPTWYETAASDLPAGKDDKRRHFVHEEVEACRRLRGIDVFLSHEAARPFPLVQTRASGVARRIDAGKTPINEVLAAMQPRLHLFGHHHKYSVAERQKVPSIGLDMASESYLIFDGKTLAHQLMKSI
jgi:hypothetical protein